MKIAEVAPLWKEIPPKKYGGVELVVGNVTEGLVEKGHEVTLFACGGSKTKGKLVEVIPGPMYDLMKGFSWNAISPYEFLEYYEIAQRIKEGNFDVIHNHVGFHFLAFAPLINIPIITTIHSSLPPDFPYLAERFKDENYVSISDSQRELAPYLNYLETIYHGIDIGLCEPRLGGESDYFLFLGSFTKNKGVDLAVRAASELGVNLILAGEMRDSDQVFFDKKVKPYIDGKKIKNVGEVGMKEKNKLLRGAKALLFPSQWSEAFGLVMVESLANGTPVIAYNKGSVPEVISDGETGFVVSTLSAFKEKMTEVDIISRKVCREEAEKRFSTEVMVENYLKLFSQLIKGNDE